MDGYSLLVYTTPVDTVFRTVSLATQTRLAFVIHLPAFLGILQARFASFLKKKKELFGAGYPLVWYILKQLFISVSVKSGRYFPRRYATQQISTTIHLHFGEFLLITWSQNVNQALSFFTHFWCSYTTFSA